MNLLEMVLALFAVLFFTTVALVYNRVAWDSMEYIDDSNKVIQATHLGHRYLDEVDAKLFSKQLAFNNITTNFNFTQTVNLVHPSYVYTVQATAFQCDSMGVALSTPVTKPLYSRVNIRMTTPYGMKVPVQVFRIYSRTNYNI
ncbi:MAG: hypothetical protein FJ042_01450 [Candidatus Cloacimonetes bacterium]|nr:hypothetical protein [Candidatus Cloacimonadota bacterium]